MRILKAMVFLAATSLTTSAFSADCSSPSGGIGLDSAQENLQCIEKVQKVNDKKLNDSYKKLLSVLKDDPDQENFTHTQLVAAERAWIAFRDAECELKTGLAGGAHQWHVVNQAQCVSDMTAQRASDLEKYYGDAKDN